MDVQSHFLNVIKLYDKDNDNIEKMNEKMNDNKIFIKDWSTLKK